VLQNCYGCSNVVILDTWHPLLAASVICAILPLFALFWIVPIICCGTHYVTPHFQDYFIYFKKLSIFTIISFCFSPPLFFFIYLYLPNILLYFYSTAKLFLIVLLYKTVSSTQNQILLRLVIRCGIFVYDFVILIYLCSFLVFRHTHIITLCSLWLLPGPSFHLPKAFICYW